MENREVLHIGVGRCGNVIVDGLIRSNKSFVGLLYNTAANDMNELESFEEETAGILLVPNADGSGKDPKLAKRYAINNIDFFEEQLRKYSMSNNFVFYFSMDGGTGSGSTAELIKCIYSLYQGGCSINVVPFIRSKFLSKIQLENTISCWREINTLAKQGVINSVMYVDNDSRDTEEEINEEFIRLTNYAYSLKDMDNYGTLDTTDMGRYFNEKGYRAIYYLDNKQKDFETALNLAIEKSIFLKPNRYNNEKMLELINNDITLTDEEKEFKCDSEKKTMYQCIQLIGTIQENKFEQSDVLSTIKAVGNHKLGCNPNNVICMSGMKVPKYKLEDVKSKYKMAQMDFMAMENDEDDDSLDELIGDISIAVGSAMPTKRKKLGRQRKNVDDMFNKDLWKKRQ